MRRKLRSARLAAATLAAGVLLQACSIADIGNIALSPSASRQAIVTLVSDVFYFFLDNAFVRIAT